MTNPIPQDELIALAKEAGFEQIMNEAPTLMCSPEELAKFAQLIQQRGQTVQGNKLHEAAALLEQSAEPFDKACALIREAIAGCPIRQPVITRERLIQIIENLTAELDAARADRRMRDESL